MSRHVQVAAVLWHKGGHNGCAKTGTCDGGRDGDGVRFLIRYKWQSEWVFVYFMQIICYNKKYVVK